MNTKKYLGLFGIIFTIVIGTTGILDIDASVGNPAKPCITAHVALLKWLCPKPVITEFPSNEEMVDTWNRENCDVDINTKQYFHCDGTNPYENP
jgi:hypothetical protein